jgi:hypothetical protein
MFIPRVVSEKILGLNGNSAIHYFTNTCNGFQVLKQKSAIPII